LRLGWEKYLKKKNEKTSFPQRRKDAKKRQELNGLKLYASAPWRGLKDKF